MWIGVFLLISARCFFNPACHPIYTSSFISGGILSVGFSSDGGTIVSVDDESGQKVVAFDAASGYIVSSTYSLICRVFFCIFSLTGC